MKTSSEAVRVPRPDVVDAAVGLFSTAAFPCAVLATSCKITPTANVRPAMRDLSSVHPGVILQDDYLAHKPGLQDEIAAAGLDADALAEILAGSSDITRSAAQAIAQATGTAPFFWLHLQTEFNRRKSV